MEALCMASSSCTSFGDGREEIEMALIRRQLSADQQADPGSTGE
jgi:hypothetical protein